MVFCGGKSHGAELEAEVGAEYSRVIGLKFGDVVLRLWPPPRGAVLNNFNVQLRLILVPAHALLQLHIDIAQDSVFFCCFY